MPDLIPHQLHLSPAQKRKLLSGLSVQISHAKMGAGAGSDVLHLNGKNAKKILSAYKKVKGVRITLDPEEIGISGEGLYGGKIHRMKKAKKWEQFGVDTANDALGLAGKAKTMFGYGVSRSKKAKKWEQFGVDTANDALGLYNKASSGFGLRENVAERMANLRARKRGPIGANSMKPRSLSPDEGRGLYGYGLYGSGLESAMRKRGRPRIMGRGAATESKAFRTAMRINKQVVSELPVVVKSMPSGRATINSRVRPSSSEMTLSPYQSMTSPAMNPYVPKNAYQNGGVDYNL